MKKNTIVMYVNIVVNGNVGNAYTLYTDGTILESVDGQSYIPGLKEYVTVEAKEGWTIKDYLQYIDLIISERNC